MNNSLGIHVGLISLIMVCPAAAAEDVLDAKLARVSDDGATLWYDVRNMNLEGKGWTETASYYDRLPAKAEGVVRDPVWSLSRDSAGMCVRFVTDATTIHARWTLKSDRLAMANMPATGVSGLDLYVKTESGQWRWLAVGPPSAVTSTARLAAGIPPGKRQYMLYLPLYNGVERVEIGLAKDATLAKAPPRANGGRRPILFYGTSITHGCCASRPGMVHTAILGRRLEWPIINLGFSGNGRMEPELADLMAELDPAVYVLDCLPNMRAQDVTERVEPFVKKLRKAHPTTPIVLVEDRSYANSFLLEGPRQRNLQNRAALREAHKRLVAAGVKNLHYIAGETLLGDDGEDTVDSSHPTDLGFMRQAAAFERTLRPLLHDRRGS